MRPGASSLPRIVSLLAVSAAAHIVAFAALPHRLAREQRPPEITPPGITATDSWEVLAATQPPEPEPPAVPAATPPVASSPSQPRPHLRAPRPPLPGRTLTSDQSDSSWSSAVGDGAALPEPEPVPGPPTPAPVQLTPAVPMGPTVVPLASLSRRPQPPGGLDVLLQRFYPRRARSQGIEGAVTVRMRVLPDGRVDEIRVLDERPASFDFAGACRQMLHAAPPFVPPLDRAGKRVATDVAFRCTFELDH